MAGQRAPRVLAAILCLAAAWSLKAKAYFKESGSELSVLAPLTPTRVEVLLESGACLPAFDGTATAQCSFSPNLAYSWVVGPSSVRSGACGAIRLRGTVVALPGLTTVNTAAGQLGDVRSVAATGQCTLTLPSNPPQSASFELGVAIVPVRLPAVLGAIAYWGGVSPTVETSWSDGQRLPAPLAPRNSSVSVIPTSSEIDAVVAAAVATHGLPATIAAAPPFTLGAASASAVTLLAPCLLCRAPSLAAACASLNSSSGSGSGALARALSAQCGFDASTRVWVSGLEARVLHTAADGSHITVETPSYASACPAGNSYCSPRTFVVASYEPRLHAAPGLSANMSALAAWARNASGTSTFTAPQLAVPPAGGRIACPGFCPGQPASDAAFPLDDAGAVSAAMLEGSPRVHDLLQSSTLRAVAWDPAARTFADADGFSALAASVHASKSTGGLSLASAADSSPAQAVAAITGAFGAASSGNVATLTSSSPSSATSSSSTSGALLPTASVSSTGGIKLVADCSGQNRPVIPLGPAVCRNASDPRSRSDYCPFVYQGRCTACPQHALCPYGEARPLPGYFAANAFSPRMEACPPPAVKRCAGWNATIGAVQCGEGYLSGSQLCSACAPGFYSQYTGGACKACPAASGAWAVFRPILWLVLGVAAFTCTIYAIMWGLARWRGGKVRGGFMRSVSLFYW